jgi:CubicO group peptidase (beta-lactamase class C family)
MAGRDRLGADRVSGHAEPGYGAVADTFRRHIATGVEVGAACAVFHDGRPVVDLWGGERDGPRRLPWRRDTLVPVFSTTKGMASMVMAVAHARGLIDFDERVARYWPEFAQNGKREITVRQLLSHRAGLAALDEPLERDVLGRPDELTARLARQAPLWEPGQRQGYHAWTLGFYEAALFQRVDPAGRTIGRAFAEDIAAPLDLDFHIGLPDDIPDDRLATFHGVHPARGLLRLGDTPRGLLLGLMNPRSLTARAFLALPLARHPDDINDRALLRLELPAVGGVGDARSIARAYGDLATGGQALGLTAATLAAFEAPVPPPPGGRRDLVLRFEIPFSLGFAKPFPGFPMGSSDRAYAMAGAGGSIGMADPDTGIGFAYTPNLMGFGSPTDPREVALRSALYRCIGGRPQDPSANGHSRRTRRTRRSPGGGTVTPSRGGGTVVPSIRKLPRDTDPRPLRPRDVLGVPALPPAAVTGIADRARAGLARLHRGMAPPPARIMESALAGLEPAALATLCHLEIPDHLDAPVPLPSLAARLDVDAHRLRRLLAYAHVRGWIRMDRRGRVHATRVTRFLRRDHPGGWRAWVVFAAGDEISAAMAHLDHGLERHGDAFAAANGSSFFEWMVAHPDRHAAFDAAMAAGARMHGLLLANDLDWADSRRVCDVGGGDGTLLDVLTTHHPHLEGVVLELPDVVARMPERPRVTGEAGDAFAAVPTGFDTYLYVNVLHDWDDGDATRLLQRAADAIRAGGNHGAARVVVVDSQCHHTPVDDLTQRADLLMLALTPGGRERSTSEFAALGRAAGLQLRSTRPLVSGDVAHTLILQV